jgi:hypothetical protein
MKNAFGYKAGKAQIALKFDDYYVWDCSVIKSGGKYHMFCSRWKKEHTFGWNWVFNSEIVHCVADAPEGPYQFQNVVLPRRGRQYFDGMNTHISDALVNILGDIYTGHISKYKISASY